MVGGLFLTNSVVTGSSTCLLVEGASVPLLGGDLTIGGTSFGCTGRPPVTAPWWWTITWTVRPKSLPTVAISASYRPAIAFFQSVGCVGAFGDSNWTAGWTVPAPSATRSAALGCPAGTEEASRQLDGVRVCELTGEITGT